MYVTLPKGWLRVFVPSAASNQRILAADDWEVKKIAAPLGLAAGTGSAHHACALQSFGEQDIAFMAGVFSGPRTEGEKVSGIAVAPLV